MARIVTYAHRYKRPARKKPPVALEVPTVVTMNKCRHPPRWAAAETVSQSPRLHDEAAQPSTTRGAGAASGSPRQPRASPPTNLLGSQLGGFFLVPHWMHDRRPSTPAIELGWWAFRWHTTRRSLVVSDRHDLRPSSFWRVQRPPRSRCSASSAGSRRRKLARCGGEAIQRSVRP
jgi:hypothetical protein